MYTLMEQITMIVYFIILGMFITIMFDTINAFFSKKALINYIVQVVFWIIMILICLKSVDKISDGHLPIYIILFFIVGYFIYVKLLKKKYIETLNKIKSRKRKIVLIILPVELFGFVKRIYKKHFIRRKKHEKSLDNIDIITSDIDNHNVGVQ